jgi:hypothetical protein
MADGDTDEDEVWRCKACGQRQRDPTPPCEQCWNTKLVRGAGAADAAGVDGRSRFERLTRGPGQAAGLLTRVQWSTSRAAALSLVAALGLAWVHDTFLAGSLLSEAGFTGAVTAGILTALFLSVTLGIAVWRTVDALVDA